MISECLYLSGLGNWVIWKADSLRCALKEVERTRKWLFIFVQTRLPQNGRAGKEVKSLQRFLFTLLSWRKCIIQMKNLATSRLVHINTKRLINYLRLVFAQWRCFTSQCLDVLQGFFISSPCQ